MLKYWVYRHPVLAILLPFIPCAAVMIAMVYFDILSLPWVLILSTWIILLLAIPVRRAYPMIMAEATNKLQRDCDALAYLAGMAQLRRRKGMSRDFYVMVEANYANGLEAAGRADEALACLRALHPMRDSLPPHIRYQLDMTYACICRHDAQGRQELPGLLSMLEQGYHTIPFAQPVRESLRRNLDALQDIVRYYNGQYEGLRERFVARVEAYRPVASMRRNMLVSCMWLARVYEALGRPGDAMAMYRYVAENGNTLGIVAEAEKAIGRVTG